MCIFYTTDDCNIHARHLVYHRYSVAQQINITHYLTYHQLHSALQHVQVGHVRIALFVTSLERGSGRYRVNDMFLV